MLLLQVNRVMIQISVILFGVDATASHEPSTHLCIRSVRTSTMDGMCTIVIQQALYHGYCRIQIGRCISYRCLLGGRWHVDLVGLEEKPPIGVYLKRFNLNQI